MFNLEPYSTADAIANAITLSLTVVGGLAILVLARRAPAAAPAAPAGAAAPGAGSPARIEGVPERGAHPFVRFAYRSSRKRTGGIMDPLRVNAHHPMLLMGYGMFELATERSHRVPERLKQLAVMRAAMLAGCEWCLDFGSAELKASGIAEETLRELPTYRESQAFSDLEKLVLDYATGMSRTPVDVSDELFAGLRSHLDEGQLVELTSVIALENYRGRFNWAFGIGSQGFSEGAYCVRPTPAEDAPTTADGAPTPADGAASRQPVS
jgi:AhpD family alkylhydroperoxidase